MCCFGLFSISLPFCRRHWIPFLDSLLPLLGCALSGSCHASCQMLPFTLSPAVQTGTYCFWDFTAEEMVCYILSVCFLFVFSLSCRYARCHLCPVGLCPLAARSPSISPSRGSQVRPWCPLEGCLGEETLFLGGKSFALCLWPLVHFCSLWSMFAVLTSVLYFCYFNRASVPECHGIACLWHASDDSQVLHYLSFGSFMARYVYVLWHFYFMPLTFRPYSARFSSSSLHAANWVWPQCPLEEWKL